MECPGHVKLPIWTAGCGKRNCPRCGPQRTRRQARRVLSRLKGHNANAWTLVLTVPPEDRERFLNPRTWKKAIGLFHKLLVGYLGISFMYERSHPHGENLADGFHPHANILFTTPRGTKKLDLDKLKDFWLTAAKLSRRPNIYAQYIPLDADSVSQRLQHWIAYVERPFPNAFWQGNRSRWYGKAPQRHDTDAQGCPICGKPLQTHWITDAERRDLEEYYLHGLLPGYDRQRDGASGEIWRMSQDKCSRPCAPPQRGPRRARSGHLFPTKTATATAETTDRTEALRKSLLSYFDTLSPGRASRAS